LFCFGGFVGFLCVISAPPRLCGGVLSQMRLPCA
jgi:hypothetical protein